MKIDLKKMLFLSFFTTIVFSGCNKNDLISRTNSGSSPPPSFSYPKEMFWGNTWQRTATGYELDLPTQMLTPDQITRGIRVEVAIIGIDDSPWTQIPNFFYDPIYFQDTLYVAYNAIPGHLYIKTQTISNMTRYRSDAIIEYH